MLGAEEPGPAIVKVLDALAEFESLEFLSLRWWQLSTLADRQHECADLGSA
jgi:hypothetical protein